MRGMGCEGGDARGAEGRECKGRILGAKVGR